MKKQILLFIFLILVLILFNNLIHEFFYSPSMLDSNQLVNKQQVTSQKLFNDTWKIIRDKFYDSSLNVQDWKRWKDHYKGKIKNDADADIAINTMLESLNDPYSRYLNKSNYAEQNTSINSKISGIGANIAAIRGKTYVVSVIDGTPADIAKLKSGDIILKVNNKNVGGMKTTEVVGLVRGPKDSKVKLTILRNNKTIVKTLARKEIKIKTVESSVDKNIGYIKIISFIGETTPSEFVNALQKTSKTKGLIIDLRGNTGGLLPNAVFISNLFINKGTLVSIVGRNGYKNNIYAQDNDYIVKKPMLILVNEGSASASEIFSGALKDYHKAKLIGTRTFGKGMVQKIYPLPNQTGLNLTIAKYLTPAGHDINKKGITPDIEVKETYKDYTKRKDTQLNKAKLIMSEMISKK